MRAPALFRAGRNERACGESWVPPLSDTMEELEPRPSLRLLAPFLGPLVVIWLAAAALIAAQIV